MQLKYSLLALFILLTTNTPIFAHPGGHGIELTPQQATLVAYNVIQQFIEHDPELGFGKLDKSWASLPEAAKQVHVTHHDYYIIRFTNRGMTLYVLMSVSGDVFDVNQTGVFEGLK